MNTQDILTSKIIKALEGGDIPWLKPWSEHQNLDSKRAYNGINRLLLAQEAEEKEYNCNYWLTFNQIKKAGGHLKKGSKACPIAFWKISTIEDKEKEGEEKTSVLLRYYNVFNASCVEGIDIPESKGAEELLDAEEIVKGFSNKPAINYSGGRACYYPIEDKISIPNIRTFKDSEGYYTTLFHELVHSTGHKSRLNRKGVANPSRFRDERYAKEELVAELGGAFLEAKAGIAVKIDNHAAYIQSWLKALKDDTRMIIYAASQADKAAAHILGS